MRILARLLAALALLAAASAPALASPCASVPNIFIPNTSILSSQVNANFSAVVSCFGSSAASGSNTDITSLGGLTTPLSVTQGGTPLFIGGTSTGAANAQVVATTTPNAFAKTQGYLVSFIAGFSNSGALTLNVHATGATAVQKMSAGALTSLVTGDVIAGTEYYATWDGSNYELLNPSNSIVTPLSVANGGTGLATITAHGIMVGEAASNVAPMAAGTNGQVPIGNTSADPTWFTPYTVTAFTTHGTSTYTPATGEYFDWVRCVGSGGGGGGTAGSGGSIGAAAAGGGAGAYSEAVVSVTPGSGVTVTVGQGGAGGTNVPGAGGAGNTSSFGSLVVATGGSGGGAQAVGGSAGGAGGTTAGATGTVKMAGGDGGDGTTNNGNFYGLGGNGGASQFGGGGKTGSGGGAAGKAPGGGGGGAWGSGANTGGAGADGACIIVALP